ncbi:hypothetical protein [Roseovarius sp.]|uniref:hypothetical protein n=1 Tax=Roseovarius sp. TaxID=1486281 RepID=UPI002614BC2E|nr:hypothetical protein [Roseovarius sp.]
MSRSLCLPLLTALLLGACAPLDIYYKEGADVARSEANLTECQVSALARVPRDMRTRFIPTRYAPYTACNAGGRCYTRYRLISPPRTETHDLNARLRHKVVDQCMAEAGYRPVSLPQCDSATTRATALHATQTLPPLTPQSCVIRLKSGNWQIVTP